MLRPFALIGTVGMMAVAISTAGAQENSHCQNCDNGGAGSSPVYTSGDWYYAECDECDDGGHCSLCSSKSWPDKGWNPPARYPVNRDGIWYQNMWPQAWYGNPGGGFISDVPMVYQPTDTTQLGYSYAKVPTWQTQNRIPPTPCPSRFHARVCVPRTPCCRKCIDGCPAGNPCQSGNCQHCQQGYAMNMMPQFQGQQVVMMPPGATTTPATTNVTPVRRASGRPKDSSFGVALFKKLFN